MHCVEISFRDLGGELAHLWDLWVQITGGGPYQVDELGFGPLRPFLSHRATIVHITDSDDPLDWIIQAFTSDFDSLANHSFVGRRFGEIPDNGYTSLIAPSLRATRDGGRPLAHSVDGLLDDQPVIYQKLTLPLFQDNTVAKLVTVSREAE